MKKRLLIVEDNYDVAQVLSLHAQLRGIEVAIATDTKEARQALSTFKPDWVLLELRLPKESGLLLIRDTKQNLLKKDIHIIIYSTEDDPTTIQTAFELGADDFFSKPSPLSKIFRSFENHSLSHH